MLTLHPRRPEITVGETTVRVPPSHWQFLHILADHPGETVPIDESGRLMGYDSELYAWHEYVRQIVWRIRRDFRKANLPDPIETVPGRGYKLRGEG